MWTEKWLVLVKAGQRRSCTAEQQPRHKAPRRKQTSPEPNALTGALHTRSCDNGRTTSDSAFSAGLRLSLTLELNEVSETDGNNEIIGKR